MFSVSRVFKSVPTLSDYGTSFSDVVQGLEHVLETLGSDRISAPSSFKYRDALEKQFTSSNLHVLGLASCSDDEPVYEFLFKKASFLEDWFKSLCSSLEDISNQPGEETSSVETVKDESPTITQRKEILHKTIGSLIEIYRRSNHQRIARRFWHLIFLHIVPWVFILFPSVVLSFRRKKFPSTSCLCKRSISWELTV